MEPSQPLDASTALIRLGVTFFFVATNGFFVTAEFAWSATVDRLLLAVDDTRRSGPSGPEKLADS